MASPTRARRTDSANSCRPRRTTADRLSPMPCSTSSSSKVSSSSVNRVGTGVVTRISIRSVEQQAGSVPESGGSRRFQILDMFALLVPDPSGDPLCPDGHGGRVGEAVGSCRSTIECCGRGDRRSAGCAAVDGADTVATLLIAGRFLGALLAVGGLVSAAAGLITLDRALIVGGLLQAALCAVLLGLGGSRQHVVEATGRSGSFVIRVARPRLWRSARALGPVSYSETSVTERDAIAAAERLSAAIRHGEDLTTHP